MAAGVPPPILETEGRDARSQPVPAIGPQEVRIMTAAYYSDTHEPPKPPVEDRRTQHAEPATAPKRRINDTWFNKARWVIVIALWLLVGLAVFGYLIRALSEG